MIKTGFETRVKTHQIIENQLPEFILEESPKATEFLKQYYISQEFQGGTVDIAENLDQYLKLDNLTPEVVVDHSILSQSVSNTASVIPVSNTKGFPEKYGLLKIDDEIITYTDKTANSFTGCIRGFSGITTYHSSNDQSELVFSTSSAASHSSGKTVQNLSSLFLREFFQKLKYTLTPGLEDLSFTNNLNVGNFIKESKSLYQSKGTEESFRILFNVLYNSAAKIINLENFLLKPSYAEYLRREIVIVENISSGDPFKLVGQTIRDSSNPNVFGSVSSVDILNRKGIEYYQLSLFVGYDEITDTQGTFNITPKTLVTEEVESNSSVISVDSTIGFPDSGTLICGNNVITYKQKSVNQFFECSGIEENISVKDSVRTNDFAYGYEDGDLTREVRLRVTGILNSFVTISSNFSTEEGSSIFVKSLGEIIDNPTDERSYKQSVSNSWIYNVSSRYEIQTISGSTFSLASQIDKSSLKIGDEVEILIRNTQNIVSSTVDVPFVQSINIQRNQVTLGNLSDFSYNQNLTYDIRRKLKKSNSLNVPIEFGNDRILSDVQNVYNQEDDYLYVKL